ncbi:MAG: hypothetical protein ACHQET_00920 [Chitinophagales bacterium]
MELRIEKEMKIKDIQKLFSKHYPYLKIEFFKKPHARNKLSPRAEMLDSNEAIQHFAKFRHPAKINIDGMRTIEQVERDFWELFGMPAQVFRKSGNTWIETSLTDGWALDKQNKEGEYFNTHIRGSLDKRMDDDGMDSD